MPTVTFSLPLRLFLAADRGVVGAADFRSNATLAPTVVLGGPNFARLTSQAVLVPLAQVSAAPSVTFTSQAVLSPAAQPAIPVAAAFGSGAVLAPAALPGLVAVAALTSQAVLVPLGLRLPSFTARLVPSPTSGGVIVRVSPRAGEVRVEVRPIGSVERV